MTQFEQPFAGMPYVTGYTTVLPISYPPETASQSIPSHRLTFHSLGGPYSYSFMPTPHTSTALSFPVQNVDPFTS